MAFPTNPIFVDDFNRADGTIYAGAGASIWSSTDAFGNTTDWKIVSNRGKSNAGSSLVYTLNNYGPDIDLVIVVGTPFETALGSFQVHVRAAVIAANNYNSYYFHINRSSANQWTFARIANGGNTGNTVLGTQAVAAGDQIGISAQGNQLGAYYKPSGGGSWTQIGSNITNSVLTGAGRVMMAGDSGPIDTLGVVSVTPVALAATDAGGSTDTGTLGTAINPATMAGTSAGGSTDTGTLRTAAGMAATSAGASSDTATLSKFTPALLNGTSAGDSSDTGTLSKLTRHAVRIRTSEDWQDLAIQGPPGPGVPAGGSTSQALVKTSDGDYDTEWQTVGGAFAFFNG